MATKLLPKSVFEYENTIQVLKELAAANLYSSQHCLQLAAASFICKESLLVLESTEINWGYGAFHLPRKPNSELRVMSYSS